MIVSRFSKLILGIVAVIVGAWLVVPTLVVVPMSFNGKASLVFPITDYQVPSAT